MISNQTTVKRGSMLRLMLYTRPDRSSAVQMDEDTWLGGDVDLPGLFSYGTRHDLPFTEDSVHISGEYMVAMFPFVRRVADPEGSDKRIIHVTIYLAKAEDWPLFTPVEEMDPREISEAML